MKRAGRSLSLCAAVLLAGCFEAGPLGVSAGLDAPSLELPIVDGAVDVPLMDLAPPDVPVDPGPPADAVACVDDTACADLASNACTGSFVCTEGYCQLDPAAEVQCPDDGDPCTESTCDPSTGACQTLPKDDPGCVCQPIAIMPCGGFQQLSTADPGETNLLQDYSCGPSSGGALGEHVWLFSTDTTQLVSVATSSGEPGGVWVLGYDGSACVPEACFAGGEKGLSFEAQAGFDYAVVLEHPPGLPVLVGLSVICGVVDEFSCTNGIDDDLNGQTDCADTHCAASAACTLQPESNCTDEVDNDDDSLTDCEDGDCAGAEACKQSCDAVASTTCGQQYGSTTAGGKAEATDYSCGPAAAGDEVAFVLPTGVTGDVTITLTTDAPLRIYILEGSAQGCDPANCHIYGDSVVNFQKPPGTEWYVVVDGDAGVVDDFSISVECD